MHKRMNRKGMEHKGLDHNGLGHRVLSGPVRGPARQRGSVLALVAVGMLAIIGMAGLALQSGHLFVNKTHVQNALDAAALSAAKTLNNDGTVAQAEAAGRDAFEEHVAPATGDSTFLEREMRDSSYTLTFEFSATLFAPGTAPATFVRASATEFTVDTWLANVLPGVGDEQDIGGTAVAGPAAIDPDRKRCDIMPLMMCAKDLAAGCNASNCYGFPVGAENELCLKAGSPGQGEGGGGGGGGPGGGGGGPGGGGGDVCEPFAPGTGNFQLLDLECPDGAGGGGACIRKQLAGEYSGCAKLNEGEPVETAPGNKVGPTVQGINTRFWQYQGAGLNETDHPPDVVTDTGLWHAGYLLRYDNEDYDHEPIDDGPGVLKRREVAVPIGDCTDPGTGVTNVPVLEVACFFLTKPATQGGGPDAGEIYGQLTSTDCAADGEIATAPPGGGGTLQYKIVLYKDPDSRDS